MKLNSHVWDNVWTDLCLCIKYWCLCDNRDLWARTYLIRVFRKKLVVIRFAEYPGCVDPCHSFMLGFEEDWIIEKLIDFLFWLNYVYYKNLFSLAYPCFSGYGVNYNDGIYKQMIIQVSEVLKGSRIFFESYIVNVCIFL